MKKVLVTGCAGFIGYHLSKSLLEKDYQVIGIDCLISGSQENARLLRKYDRFEFIQHDITNPMLSLDLTEIEEIYNLACPASPVHYQVDPIFTWKTCVIGVSNVIDLALKNNARILHTSTSEIYGDPNISPQHEEYWGYVNPIGIRSCYDEGKRAAETILMDYYRRVKLDIRIVRIFNTYGPYMRKDDGRVVSNFIVQALNGKPLSIYGDGSQTRSFCYVDDLVEGIDRMMHNSINYQGPVNLGNPNEFTISELAEKIRSNIDSKIDFKYKPLPADDPKQRKPDISLAKKILGWEPKVDLDDGLKNTIKYFAGCLMLIFTLFFFV